MKPTWSLDVAVNLQSRIRHPCFNTSSHFLLIFLGAEVFFPDAEARRAHLLSLVEKVMEESKAVSLSYTFESLCRFFSNKDASGLLGLPEHLPQVLVVESTFVKINKYIFKHQSIIKVSLEKT